MMDLAEGMLWSAVLALVTRDAELARGVVASRIERTGDIAVAIAQIAIELASERPLYNYDDLLTLAGMVHGMMHDARAAFADADLARAEAVLERRHEVMGLYGRVLADLVERMRHDARSVQRATCLSRAAWALTRVADHTVNLAGAVLDVVLGKEVLGRSATLLPLKTTSASE